MANKIIDCWQKKGVKGVVYKMDIKKAYDIINWNYPLKVMQCMEFKVKWVRWIWWCISTTRFFVLVNGGSDKVFSMFKRAEGGRFILP